MSTTRRSRFDSTTIDLLIGQTSRRMTPSLLVPGQIVELKHAGSVGSETLIERLVANRNVEVHRIWMPAGQRIPIHEPHGDMMLLCLDGSVDVTAAQETRALKSGCLLLLPIGQGFSLVARRDSHLLATIIMPKDGTSVELIGG